jgi:cytochrome b6-f complex subunit 5
VGLALPAVVVEELCIAGNDSPSMIEPLLCGIVLGLIPVTLVGLFVAAWNQYRRGSALGG